MDEFIDDRRGGRQLRKVDTANLGAPTSFADFIRCAFRARLVKMSGNTKVVSGVRERDSRRVADPRVRSRDDRR
jgi:hypothetical protein